MEEWVLNGLNVFSDTKILMRRGANPLSHTLPTSLLSPSVQAFRFQCSPPFVNIPSGSSPFCTYISLYLVYGNVLCMIQTLIYIYSCNTVKVTKKTSR